MRHVTYFILAPKAGMVKIGQTREIDPPTNRLAQIQTGNPEQLEVLLVLDHRAPFEESQIHWRFRKYRQHGEWFDYCGELKAFIAKKRQNPLPTSADDSALGETESGKGDGYQYVTQKSGGQTPEGDGRPAMRSPVYGLAPRWGSRSDSQEYWHKVQSAWSQNIGPR